MKRGKFITFEGGEGCGKSTQVKLLSEALAKRGIDHLITREPGGTPLAEKIRPLLVENQNLSHRERSKDAQQLSGAGEDAAQKRPHPAPPYSPPQAGGNKGGLTSPGGRGDIEDWHPLAETLLFFAARVQHVTQKIQPALEAGKWVICDRFTDSTLVYQGIGKGLGVERLQAIQHSLLGDFAPDHTLLLDIDPTQGLARANSRADTETRFEELDISFHHALREGFLQLAHQDRFTVINANQSIEQVQRKIESALFKAIKE